MKKINLSLIASLILVSSAGLVSADIGDAAGCGMYGMMSGSYDLGMGIFG